MDREQTAYEERIPSKAHSPSGKVLWVYWARWLWTPGLFQCRALMWHYNLKLPIPHVQNFASICNSDLSRRRLLEHPSTKISITLGDSVRLTCPISNAHCHPFVIVLMASNHCVYLPLPPQHSLQYSRILQRRTHQPGTRPKKENANNSVDSFQNKLYSPASPILISVITMTYLMIVNKRLRRKGTWQPEGNLRDEENEI